MNEILKAASDMLILQNDHEQNAHEQNAQGERNAHGIFLGEHIAQRKMDVQHALRIVTDR